MKDVKYSQVTEYLFENLPSIRQHYRTSYSELYADNNQHVIFGSILVDYANDLMQEILKSNDCVSLDIVHKIFSILETMSASTDVETLNLVETSVLEGLLGEEGGIEKFSRYMGPKTKKLARVVAADWGLNTELLI